MNLLCGRQCPPDGNQHQQAWRQKTGLKCQAKSLTNEDMIRDFFAEDVRRELEALDRGLGTGWDRASDSWDDRPGGWSETLFGAFLALVSTQVPNIHFILPLGGSKTS
ncbi:MAG: hypothetical protein O2856_14010, partial [Planctomycetota bacterium]|nr:hypothetical protein [Planctomycetota bacterium]